MKIKKVLFVIKRKIISGINYVNPDLYTRIYTRSLIKMGMNVEKYPKYIDPSVWFDGTGYNIIEIGKNCVFSKDVVLLTHDYSISRALQAINKLDPNKDKEKFILKGIKIGYNCFIGARAIIMPGTEIGNNVIVGSGCVVKGKVPNNSIIVGNPAKIIGTIEEYAKKRENEIIE